jgi:hypothetical protein
MATYIYIHRIYRYIYIYTYIQIASDALAKKITVMLTQC